FAISDDAALGFASKRGFGVATAISEHDKPAKQIGAHVPFVLKRSADQPARLEFHVSRANPIAECTDGSIDWLFVVTGSDAYVSADWYEGDQQVPTWLYEAVHFTGPCRRMTAAQLALHSDELSAEFENRLRPKRPWTSDKMQPARRDAMRRGIVGLSMTIKHVAGQAKLNQHKSEADRIAVAKALSECEDRGSQTIARLIQSSLEKNRDDGT
ncbi:MAG: FMN-binding negative transcriptional regulator, partial [Pseudomonadota bacterium]